MSQLVQDFLASWELFGDSYACAWLASMLLAGIGALLFVRGRAFEGAAIAQASTLGVALGILATSGLALEHGTREDLLHAIAVLTGIGAAWLAGRAHRGRVRIGAEARNAWVFLAGASLSLMVVAGSPHGTEEIHRVHASSLLGAGALDLWVFAAAWVLGFAALLRWHRELRLVFVDRDTAAVLGLPIHRYDLCVTVAIGLVVGIAIHDTGFLFVFGMLVLPALLARQLVDTFIGLLVLAPVVALVGAVLGIFLAHGLDLPPGPAVVALLVIAWLPLRLVRR
ncbi:MAG: metal ABC transporter permease [Planctomycetota bacterium]